ncbi:P-type conjugative transfer protein TrbJ [Sphingomonas cavernae]|uniref:P-type conjugative transfer protein TrbJ n=1 Tax=Sphingomonas cavernae TaxID=2320861 RepID=A0A418WJV3_9SPHN|nr:P-type conjugative transfer protein TrbJ [Sphingomonas cavernae]RJF90321.1 P-type conjugative transfer protein TrbJ [Sphingomonas cavernae]
MKKYVIAGLLGAAAIGSFGAGLVVSATPARAIPVFDASNYAQNVLTAARTLQQINQQIQSLQNEAQMLANMEKHLSRIDFPQLDQLRQKLATIDRLMGQAQRIDFRVDQLDAKFRALFPDSFDQTLRLDRRVADARARLDTAMAGFQQTMTVQAQVVENVRDDAQVLSEIVAKSQGAEGDLQAAQATNQLLALTAKQQFQLQQLMAAQFRSESIEQARRVQEAQEARAATRKFLGNGKAYTPD